MRLPSDGGPDSGAWREAYTRIADELAARYPTHWGAIDWFTQIGDDPKRANYPPGIMGQIPERLRGNYNRFGWTANGIEPWGLQPDPIAADGYLFFRAWFLLLLATYKYISGDDKWAQPFQVTGYHDERFEWDTHRIAERLESQYRENPQGPHCENTKVWVFCNTAGGLGMRLYDKAFRRNTYQAFDNFVGYTRDNYMRVGAGGRLESMTMYYDPIEDFHFDSNPAGPGDWTRAFEAPHLDKYTAPTVEGIDFPALGVSQAWNNSATGVLHVATYAAAPDRRGSDTSWRVTNLPSTTGLTVRLNGQPFDRFEVIGPNSIRIDTTVDAHQFEFVTGYRRSDVGAAMDRRSQPSGLATASASAVTASAVTGAPDPFASSPGCPCCASA